MGGAGIGERIRVALDALRGQLPGPQSAQVSAGGSPADGKTDELARALIACLDLLEADEEAAANARLALAGAGVESVGAEGERFDRSRHRAQGRVPTNDPALEWTIATCASPGWARGDAVLRPAEVWVYRVGSPGEG